jgi:hypothetical protein
MHWSHQFVLFVLQTALYAMRHLYFQFSWFDFTLWCKRVHFYFFCSWWKDVEFRQKCIILLSLQVYWSLLLRSSLVVTANPWWRRQWVWHVGSSDYSTDFMAWDHHVVSWQFVMVKVTDSLTLLWATLIKVTILFIVMFCSYEHL